MKVTKGKLGHFSKLAASERHLKDGAGPKNTTGLHSAQVSTDVELTEKISIKSASQKKVNVLHFSYTPLAGSPIRIVNALNQHTSISARLVNLDESAYKTRVFQEDLSWSKNRQEALQLLENADIIHLHNWIDLNDNKFGIDFKKCQKKGQLLIRQFHTNPEKLAKTRKIDSQAITSDPIAQLVLAQFHERYYPRARIVPNIVPIFDQDYLPKDKSQSFAPRCQVFFSPTSMRLAWASRWDTKGAIETIKIINTLKRSLSFDFECESRLPHKEILTRKRNSDIVIDEVVTGSYHISTLEGLSQGKPTLAYTDQRTISNIYEITGSVSQLPIVNTQLEDLGNTVEYLIKNRSIREDIGQYSREWMEKYWSDKNMIQHYVQAYNDLANNPKSLNAPRFDTHSGRAWLFVGLFDTAWLGRKARWIRLNTPPVFIQKIISFFKKLTSSIKTKI